MVTVDGSNFPLSFRRWEEAKPAPDHYVQNGNNLGGQEARSSPPLVRIFVVLGVLAAEQTAN
jgi:hypothetical protein